MDIRKKQKEIEEELLVAWHQKKIFWKLVILFPFIILLYYHTTFNIMDMAFVLITMPIIIIFALDLYKRLL